MANDKLINSDSITGEAQNFEPDKKVMITTHGELKILVKKAQEDSGKSKGAIDNAKTAYNQFLKSRGLIDDSGIDGLFDNEEQFEIYLNKYDEYLDKNGKSDTTRWSYVSHVRDYRKIYDRLAVKKLPDTFHEALLFLITSAGFTIGRFWRTRVKSLVSRSTFRAWCAGRCRPNAERIEAILRLEEVLGVEKGILLKRLPRRLRGQGELPTGLTSFGRKMQEALKSKYGVWNDRLEKQFGKLMAHMSSPVRPEGAERNSVWTSSDGADVPTADIVQSYLRSFFGFCCLPKAEPDPFRNDKVKANEKAAAYKSGLGMKQERMTLALLAVKYLAVKYLEFQRIRAGGVYTEGTVTFISTVTALLRPGSGYIYQHPELSNDLKGLAEDDLLTWHERCSQTRERLIEFLRDLEEGDHIDYGRDPMEPIQPILDQERPLSVLFQMLEAIKKDMPPSNARRQARALHFRNYLLILMLTAVPLRIRMYSIMRIGKHPIKDSNGSWWLSFSRKDFKNRRAKNKRRSRNRNSSRKANRGGVYKIQLPPEVWPQIEEYLDIHRQYFVGADTNDFLFLPARGKNRKQFTPDKLNEAGIEGRLTCHSLSRIVRGMTYLYTPLEGNPGFGPHAFRHIVATDIIKKDPSVGFFLAAIALNDELETVEEEYVHLKTSEFFKPVSEHFSRRMHEAGVAIAA